MAKQEYEFIWKKGNIFEKGHWRIVPKRSLEDRIGETIFIFVVWLLLMLLLLCCVLMTLPFWLVLLSTQVIRQKRYIAGILIILGILYFEADLEYHWASKYLFFGYNNDEGEFVNGLFPSSVLSFIIHLNYFSLGIGLGFIIDALLIYLLKSKYFKPKISFQQLLVFAFSILLTYMIFLKK